MGSRVFCAQVLTLQTPPRGAFLPFLHSPQHCPPGERRQPSRGLYARVSNLFSTLCPCSFGNSVSIYTNIKILFIDSCVMFNFKAQG